MRTTERHKKKNIKQIVACLSVWPSTRSLSLASSMTFVAEQAELYRRNMACSAPYIMAGFSTRPQQQQQQQLECLTGRNSQCRRRTASSLQGCSAGGAGGGWDVTAQSAPLPSSQPASQPSNSPAWPLTLRLLLRVDSNLKCNGVPHRANRNSSTGGVARRQNTALTYRWAESDRASQ